MQVSWIEPEEIRALVERLQEARPKARALGWELHTLPDEAPGVSTDRAVEVQALWSHVVDMAAQPPPAPPHLHASPAADAPLEPPSDQPELDRIRQKLRALRSKAEVAGLLRTVPEAAPPPAAPEPRIAAAPMPSAKAPEGGVFASPEEGTPAVMEPPSLSEPDAPRSDAGVDHEHSARGSTAGIAASDDDVDPQPSAEASPNRAPTATAEPPAPLSGTHETVIVREAQELPHVVAVLPPREIAPAVPVEEIFPTDMPDVLRSPEPHEDEVAAAAKPGISDVAIADALHEAGPPLRDSAVRAADEASLTPATKMIPEEAATTLARASSSPAPAETSDEPWKVGMERRRAAGDDDAGVTVPDVPHGKASIEEALDAHAATVAGDQAPKAESSSETPKPAQSEPAAEAPPSVLEPARSASPFKLADFVPTGSRASVPPLSAQPAHPGEPARDEAPEGGRIQAPSAEIALAPAPPAVAPSPSEPSLPAVVLPAETAAPPRMVIEVPPPLPHNPELSFEIPLGNMPERLQAFAGWAMRRTRTTEFLIVDAHGDVLWGRHMHAGLVVSTMLACTAALRSSAIGAAELLGVIEQPLPAEKILSVIPCQTCYGVINIAVVRRDGVEEPEAALLRRALVAAIEARPPGEDAGNAGSAID